jgi:hypothetical protein
MGILSDVSLFHERLFEHALKLYTAFGVFRYDESSHTIQPVADADNVRSELAKRNLLMASWICFSVATECLFKAVLCKHECLNIERKNVTQKDNSLDKQAVNYAAARDVYAMLKVWLVHADSFPWLARELRAKKVTHLFDFSTRTLGACIDSLGTLEKRGKITQAERRNLFNAMRVLSDVRRNVDAHTFYGITVGGSLQGDLDNLYQPSISLLLDVYHRA